MLHRLIATANNEVFSEVTFARGNDRRIPENRNYLTKRQAKLALRHHALIHEVVITGFYVIPILPDPAIKAAKQELNAEQHARRQAHFAKQRLRNERRAHLKDRHLKAA